MKQKNYLIFGIIVFVIGIILVLSTTLKKNERFQESKEWVEISVFCQCCKEPWGTNENIKSFFEQQGITVYEIRIRSRGFVCQACSCPSYEIKEILVKSTEKDKVLKILNSYEGVIEV